MSELYGVLKEEPREPFPAEPTAPMAQVLPISEQDKRFNKIAALKRSRTAQAIRLLAIVQLATAIWIFILGIGCVGVLVSNIEGHYNVGCYAGSGIWVGVFAIVTSAIGIGATRFLSNRCLLTAYFVLCVCASILSAYLLIISSVHARESADNLSYYKSEVENYSDRSPDDRYYYSPHYGSRIPAARTGLGLNICLALLAFLFGMSAILVSSFICVIWGRIGCCGGSASQSAVPNVIFVQASNQGPSTSAAGQTFVLQGQPAQGQQMLYLQQPVVQN